MKVKVCGMRDAENIKAVEALKPDFMGFIFYPRSPRCCEGINLDVIASLPEEVEPVMVSVDMSEAEVTALARRYGFRTLQLHGHESPEMCFSLRSQGFKVIKAMGMRSAGSLENLREFTGAVDLFLLDTLTPSKGGSGKKFDWSIIEQYDLDEPFMLSGGIGPDDAEAILALDHPKFEGIDLNSRFETAPGVKDAELLRSFLSKIRKKPTV